MGPSAGASEAHLDHAGAPLHLVRPSCNGARLRPTIARQFRDESVIGSRGPRDVRFTCAVTRQTREQTGASVTDQERTPVHSMTVRAPGIPDLITSRVTGSSASRPGTRYGRDHRSIFIRQLQPSPSGSSGGRLRVRGRFPGSSLLAPPAEAAGADQAVRPFRAGWLARRSWRAMPRRSRSSRITRAAATRSGSRVIVVASQSM